LDPTILAAATINGLLLGGMYTLVASGLTLIYGVLHIINFAHGSMLMLAMFGVFYLLTKFGVDPYLAMVVMVPVMYVFGYALYKGVIGKLANGKDENILLITLGLSILIENVALMLFKGDSRTISVSYSDRMIELGPTLVPLPKLISFAVALALCAALGLFMQRTDLGRTQHRPCVCAGGLHGGGAGRHGQLFGRGGGRHDRWPDRVLWRPVLG
jgi:branched-chain amino acid transport system permease protein